MNTQSINLAFSNSCVECETNSLGSQTLNMHWILCDVVCIRHL